jgi:hypothetical protein
MDHEGHFAEAVTTTSGLCFRMVTSDRAGQQGAPTHCPVRPIYWGRFRDSKQKSHDVEACDDHAADLYEWHRIGVG